MLGPDSSLRPVCLRWPLHGRAHSFIELCKPLRQDEAVKWKVDKLTRAYCIAQEATQCCGDLNGKETRTRGHVCVHVADSLCCTAEINTQSKVASYTPIKKEKMRLPIRFKGIRMSTAQLETHESSKALSSAQSIIHEIRRWWMRRWMLAEPIVVIISQYISVKTVMLNAFNLYSDVCNYFLIKLEK